MNNKKLPDWVRLSGAGLFFILNSLSLIFWWAGSGLLVWFGLAVGSALGSYFSYGELPKDKSGLWWTGTWVFVFTVLFFLQLGEI